MKGKKYSAFSNFTREQLEEKLATEWIYRGAILAASILAVLAAIAAIILGVWAYTGNQYIISPASVPGSGPIPSAPYGFYVDSVGAPAAMILPGDLSDYIGKQYRIFSRTSQPHTLTISATGSKFDGIGNVVTFGGAIGDGLVFEVISPNYAVVLVAKNIAIS